MTCNHRGEKWVWIDTGKGKQLELRYTDSEGFEICIIAICPKLIPSLKRLLKGVEL